MKIFVVMLLFANLAGWGWAVWQNREIAAHPSVSPVLAFALGRNELQLLDIAKASEHVAPRVMAEIAMQSTGQEASALQSGAGPAPDALAEKVSEIWCGLSGSFQEKEEATGWLSDWLRLGGQGSVVEVEETGSSTWWVHLPPFLAENEALIVLSDLQEKKIDSFYIRTGELADGISLGVFSRKESAFLVQADIERKGYAASVKEVQRIIRRYRVAVELQERDLPKLPELQKLLGKQGLGEDHERPCR